MEVEILKNNKTGRLILVDQKTGMAFTSLDKKDKVYKYLIENQSENIHDYTPIK